MVFSLWVICFFIYDDDSYRPLQSFLIAPPANF
jgi:hypothetical protein